MNWLTRLGAANRRVDALRVVGQHSPPTAAMQGATSCCRSGRCCWSATCNLVPGDVERLAAHHGLTPQALFARDLVVDVGEDERGRDVRWLRPRRAQQAGGHMLTPEETYDAETPCVYLDVAAGNVCTVQAVKPTGGARFACWDRSTHGVLPGFAWSRDALLALGWDGYDTDEED